MRISVMMAVLFVNMRGVVDVRAFGLTWEDCKQLLKQLGFSARVAIVTE